jgi:hypothetical protein
MPPCDPNLKPPERLRDHHCRSVRRAGGLVQTLFRQLSDKSASRPVAKLNRVRCQDGRLQRFSNVACSQCSVRLFALRHAREGTGFAPARRQHHGRVVHKSGEDHVAPTVEC